MFLRRPLFSCWLTAALLLAVEASATAPPTSNLEFVANRGQWPAAVEFAATLPAGQLFVERTAFTFALLTPRPHAAPDSGATARPPAGHAYRVRFAGASGGPAPVGEQPSGLLRNYLRGNDPAGWVRDAPAFGAVQYPQLYPGVDLRLHENQRQQLEYTFTVRPGGRPGAIALRYEGTDGLRLDATGNLLIATSLGRVTELAPQAWQLAPNGQPEPVPCAFVLENTTVHFRLGAYDPARPLVIDPVILFATYTGATADNWGHTAAPDAQGNLYSAGTIFAAGYPVSPGAFDPGFNGSIDVAIIKYNPNATGPAARVYATYLGGSGVDAPHRLVTNAQGELFILGTTGSANFPTTAGAYSTRFKGGASRTVVDGYIEYRNGVDLFVARLSADGRNLLGSTYVGGTGTDGFVGDNQPPFGSTLNFSIINVLEFMGDIQLDVTGNVFVAASTSSPDFPVAGTASIAYQGGQSDAVALQLSLDLQQLRWSTHLGGSTTDAAFALVPDRQGGVYVAGATGSLNFPFTATAYQSANHGSTDAFVSHLSSNGQQLAAARLSTIKADVARLLQLDAAGNVLVVGQSTGMMPVTPGCYGVPGGNFLQSLSPDLTQLRFAAVFSAVFERADIALGVDECDRIYITTMSRTFNALRFSAEARTLEYSLTLPGRHVHGASRFDSQGRLYLAVCGACDAVERFPLPAGVNSFSPYIAGNNNCNDASFIADLHPSAAFAFSNQLVCADADPLLLGGSPAGGSWSGAGVGPAPGGGYQFMPSASLIGPHTLTYTPPGGSACPTVTQRITVAAPSPIIFPILAGSPYCYRAPGLNGPIPGYVYLSALPEGGFFSGPGVSQYAAFGNAAPARWVFDVNAAGIGTHTITYTLNKDGKCGSADQTVVVRGTQLRIFPADTTLCGQSPRPIQYRASPPGGTWSGINTSPTGYLTPGNNASTYTSTYTYIDTSGCTVQKSAFARFVPVRQPDALPFLNQCSEFKAYNSFAPGTIEFPIVVLNEAFHHELEAVYYWDYGDGSFSKLIYNISPDKVQHTYQLPGTYKARLVMQFGGTCPLPVPYQQITIGEALPLPNIITPNADGLNDTFVQRQFCQAPELRVFSRWGQEVYHAAQYRNDWAAPGLPDGLYYYHFRGEEGRTAKGWLEVIH